MKLVAAALASPSGIIIIIIITEKQLHLQLDRLSCESEVAS